MIRALVNRSSKLEAGRQDQCVTLFEKSGCHPVLMVVQKTEKQAGKTCSRA